MSLCTLEATLADRMRVTKKYYWKTTLEDVSVKIAVLCIDYFWLVIRNGYKHEMRVKRTIKEE